ncbi:TPA: hypothetical protein UON57_000913 [Stenotrophomonas maltophilia]|uniref:hypothetical protein n=1 Tax=Stenotrophomonas maltophilia TaxID=40324 RepID=UPI002A95FD1F|nr:hypothetical protein [Stenotrophomonas maltophilia]
MAVWTTAPPVWPMVQRRGVRRHSAMADQLLTAALTWSIAGSLFLLVAGALWLARQAYRAARAGLRWCWRRCAHGH